MIKCTIQVTELAGRRFCFSHHARSILNTSKGEIAALPAVSRNNDEGTDTFSVALRGEFPLGALFKRGGGMGRGFLKEANVNLFDFQGI